MSGYTIREIADILNVKIPENYNNIVIRYLLTDSRSIISTADSLFFAIEGKNHDGHNYIADLYYKNVRYFVITKSGFQTEKYPDAVFFLVKNSISALQTIVNYHRSKFSVPVIGITGSNGKTVVKDWLYSLIGPYSKMVRSPRSYNSQIGVPLSVWNLSKDIELAVFEAGISFPGEMEKLEKVILPTIGLITNIGQAHQENFIDRKQKIIEKLKLFVHSETIIYCKDYNDIDTVINVDPVLKAKKLFTWSKKNGATILIKQIETNNSGAEITANYLNEDITFKIPFTDNASIENAIHCFTVMLYLGYSPDLINKGLSALNQVEMRLELKAGINNCTLINDSYSSDLTSLSIAIDFLKQQYQHSKKTVVLSDIFQTGKNETILYKEIANLINNTGLYQFIGIGNCISKHSGLFTGKKRFFSTTDEFIKNIHSLRLENEAILLKGARAFGFEKISKILQQKIHETVLEVNLNAIVHNLNYFRELLKPGVKTMAMVKAFSYGSGILEIAGLLEHQRVDYLAVAFVDEGIELRKAGISLPIMIMNPDVRNFDVMIEYNLEPEIYSFRILEDLKKTLKNDSSSSIRVHLKVDTGMKRLGFLPDEIPVVISELKHCKKIQVASVFTHLVGSENKKLDNFTDQQVGLFSDAANEIVNSLNYPVLKHVLNSSGIERFPEYQFDMVRIGIGLYGISSAHKNKLMNVSTLKTTISQIKMVSPGETVGYGRKGKVQQESVIATIPIGYADGLSRSLSNGIGKVIVNNQLAPVIGSICMDMCMIDITGIDATEGDDVIIFNEKHTISDIAKSIDTIPYEILTNISRRVKRVYYHE